MPTINIPITSGADDLLWTTSGTLSDNQAEAPIGNITPPYGPLYNAFLFRAIGLSSTDVITDARLKLVSSSSLSSSTVNAKIRANLSTNPTLESTAFAYGETQKARTVASVPWTIPSTTSGTLYTSPNIASVITEVIQLAGWNTSSNIMLFLEDNGSTTNAYRTFATYEHASYANAVLEITYTPFTIENKEVSPTTIATTEQVSSPIVAAEEIYVQTTAIGSQASVSSPSVENTGYVPNSVRFSGTPDQLAQEPNQFPSTGDWSLMFWAYLHNTQVSSTPTLFEITDVVWLGWSTNTDQLNLWVQGTPEIDEYAEQVADEWHHVTITRTGDTWKLYVDGTEKISETSSLSMGTNPLQFGSWGAGYDPLNGNIAYIKQWSVALTPSEIAIEKDVVSPVHEDDVIAWYPTQAGERRVDDNGPNSYDLVSYGTIEDEDGPDIPFTYTKPPDSVVEPTAIETLAVVQEPTVRVTVPAIQIAHVSFTVPEQAAQLENIYPDSIASEEQISASTITVSDISIALDSIDSLEDVGVPTVFVKNIFITPDSISSIEQVSSDAEITTSVQLTVDTINPEETVSIDTSILVGAVSILADSIPSESVVSATMIAPEAVYVAVGTILTSENVPEPTAANLRQEISVSAISSEELFDEPIISLGTPPIYVNWIESTAFVSDPTVNVTDYLLSPDSIQTEESFGVNTVGVASVNIQTQPIPDETSFGEYILSTGSVELTISPIDSEEYVAPPEVIPLGSSIVPISIISATTFGTALIQTGSGTITTPSIDSQSSVSEPTVEVSHITLLAESVAVDSTVGAPSVMVVTAVMPESITTEEVVEESIITVGSVILYTETIDNVPSVSAPSIESYTVIDTVSIASEEAFGDTVLLSGAYILPVSIASAEILPAIDVSPQYASVIPDTIVSEEAFYDLSVREKSAIATIPISSAEAIGYASLFRREYEYVNVNTTVVPQLRVHEKVSQQVNQNITTSKQIDIDIDVRVK